MKPNSLCGTTIQDDVLLQLVQAVHETLPAQGRHERQGTAATPARPRARDHDLSPTGLGRWATNMPLESLCRLGSPLLAPRGIRRFEIEFPALPPSRRERAKKPTRH